VRLNRVDTFRNEKLVANSIALSVIVIVALSPLLRRLYFERFWIHGRGTVIRLEGAISTNPGAGGSWVWTPVIEYKADGHLFTSRFSYMHSFNAKSKYKVGDEVEILYSPRNPSRFILNSWIEHIILAIVIAGVLAPPAFNAPNPRH
jgi:uncharacterized protein DUF3592